MSSRTTLVVIAVTAALAGGCKTESQKILSTSHLTNTHDEVGPYVVVSVVQGDPDAVTLEYSFDRGLTFHCIDMKDTGNQTFTGSLPGTRSLGLQVRYFVRTSGGQFDPPAAADAPPACAIEVADAGADASLDGGDGGRDGGTIIIRPDASVDAQIRDAGASRDETYSFEVLPQDGDCKADSDCVPTEVCVEGTHNVCQATNGHCTGDGQCAQGFSCDLGRQLCLTIRRSCDAQTGDAPCLTREVCDPTLGFCGPRPLCEAGMCPTGFNCDRARDLCLRR